MLVHTKWKHRTCWKLPIWHFDYEAIRRLNKSMSTVTFNFRSDSVPLVELEHLTLAGIIDPGCTHVVEPLLARFGCQRLPADSVNGLHATYAEARGPYRKGCLQTTETGTYYQYIVLFVCCRRCCHVSLVGYLAGKWWEKEKKSSG